MPPDAPPLVSILIPTYNAAAFLPRALTSVRNQTHDNWEAIVADNHSSDDTDDVVRRFADPRIRLLKIHNEGVIARSRNLALSQASGLYVAYLDADDWWLPGKLAQSVASLERGAGLVYHDLFLATKNRQRVFLRRARTRPLRDPLEADLLRDGNALTTSSVVVRRDVLVEAGGMSEDPRLVTMEDWDLWLRLAEQGVRFARIPETLGYYWAGGRNTSSPTRMLRNVAVIQERHREALARIALDHNVYWLRYAAGVAHQRLGQYAQAKAICRAIAFDGVPFRVRLRVIWIRLIATLLDRGDRSNATAETPP